MPASSDDARATVRLPDEVDLHARPAASFVRAAMAYASRVRVHANGKDADAKSLLGVLALGARRGTEITLTAAGEDADRAVAGLAELVAELEE